MDKTQCLLNNCEKIKSAMYQFFKGIHVLDFVFLYPRSDLWTTEIKMLDLYNSTDEAAFTSKPR